MLCRRSVLAVALVLVLGGCSASPDTSGPLPDAVGLATAAESSLAELRTAHFTFALSGVLPGLPIRQLDGDMALDEGGPGGIVRGKADMQEALDRFQVSYMIENGRLRVTDQKGRTDETAAPEAFTPVVLLAPDHGLRKLLADAVQLKTEGKEDVYGVPTYRLTGSVPKPVISSVVPGVSADVDVKFWVEQAPTRELVRVWIQVPPVQPNEGAVTLELGLSNQNKPVPPPSSSGGS